MPIPGSTLNLVRNSRQQVVVPVYNYWPAEIMAEGTITATPSEYPIGSLSVSWSTGSISNIEAGMLWMVRTGSGDAIRVVSYGVVRITPSSPTTLHIDGKSRGDSGIAVLQNYAITAGHKITVYSVKPLWSLVSRILDGKFYKKFDIPYDGSGSNPSPVVRIGPWRQAYADELGYAEFTFTASQSFAWNGKTLSTYHWQLPSSATVVSGSASSSTVTIRLPQGFHTIKCTVTDSGGASARATRPIWVNGDSFPALSDKMGYQIGSDTQDRKGRSQSLTLIGELDEAVFLPGTPIFYKEYAYYDGATINDGTLVAEFTGFAGDQEIIHDLVTGEKATSFEILGPWAQMEKIPMVSQAIVEVGSPADWTDIGIGLGIPQFIGWYILKHHCTYLELFDYYFYYEYNDFTGLPDNERKLNWGLNGGTIAEYLNQVASVIAGNIGCLSDGSLTLQKDPSVQDFNYRDRLDIRMTITLDEELGIFDVQEPVEMSRKLLNEVGQLRIFSMSYNGGGEDATNAFGSIAPGYYQMQTSGSQDEDSIIVKPENGIPAGSLGYRAGDQERTNEISGMMLAKANNPTPEISVVLNRNMDFFEPAQMLWVGLKIPPHWSSRKQAVDIRAVPLSVDRSWEETDSGIFVKTITLAIEPETYGQPGETFVIDEYGASSYPPIIPPMDVDFDDDIIKKTGVLFAINENGKLGRTKNGKNWKNVRGNIASNVLFEDIAFDFFSPYVQSGFADGTLGMWAATTRETTAGSKVYNNLSIYYTTDAYAANISWVRQHELTFSSDIHNAVRIRANQETEGYVACMVHSSNGNYCLRTSNGTSWTLTVAGDESSGGLARSPRPQIDFAFSGNRIITSGFNTSTGNFKLGYFSNATGGWVWAANSPESDSSWGCIEVAKETGLIYASRILNTTSSTGGTIGQQIYEADPQTRQNFVGSRTPVISNTNSGDWENEYVDVFIRGVPDNGLDIEDPPIPTVAGYGDPNFFNSEQGLCYTNPSDFYAYDDGWVPNLDLRRALQDFDDVNDPKAKIVVYVMFRGEVDFQEASFVGRFLYNEKTGNIGAYACSNPGLLGLIGSYNGFVGLYDKFGIQKNYYYITKSGIYPQGWAVGVEQPATMTAFGVTTTSSVVYDNQTPANNAIRYIVLKMEIAAKQSAGEYLTPMPSMNAWQVKTRTFSIDTPNLYRISGITSSAPSYLDITHTAIDADDRFVSVNPYSMSIDPFAEETINAIFERVHGGARHIARSLNSGTNWSVRVKERTYLQGIRMSSDFGLVWGYNRLEVSSDGFLTKENTYDVLGDWKSGAIDTGGNFKVLKGILIPE